MGGEAGKEKDGNERVEEDEVRGEGEEDDSEEGAVVSPFCMRNVRLTAVANCCRQQVALPYEEKSQTVVTVQMKQGGLLRRCREGNGDGHTDRRARDRNEGILACGLVRAWCSKTPKFTVQSVV